MKVLLADDDTDQLSLRAMLLESCGLEALSADTCPRALELAIEHRPPCAVVDLRMPAEKDGLALIRQLRAAQPAIYIVVLSGGKQAQLASLVRSDLADEVLPKGSSAPDLLLKLKALAEKQS